MTQEKLGIAGSGTIACGLAVVATASGLPSITLWARSAESAQRARSSISRGCERAGIDGAAVRIVDDLDALSESTFLVEAIAEDMPSKASLLRALGEIADRTGIVATTTSSLSVEELAAASGRPESFVALHVFNPVPRMRLVELVFPRAAGRATRDRAAALCGDLGKEAIVVPDVPGFVVNRLLFPYLFDAVRLMDETGLEPAAIDSCMRLGAGMPMGPLELLDFVGLDVAIAIGDAISADVPALLRALVAHGALGRKAGNGLYPSPALSS